MTSTQQPPTAAHEGRTAPAEHRTVVAAEAMRADLVGLRRDLHRTPELGLDLPLTQQAILAALKDLELEITLGEQLSSVTAVIRGTARSADSPRRSVLLRGDMDALPVTEDLDIDYASERPGLMHACGHDLHVAALVGAARVLSALRDQLAGDVVLMFQPGEEGPGGAPIMLREGLLDAAGERVEAAYALHVSSSGEPLGRWFSRSGPLMAAADEVHVRVIGQGGHGSQPHRAMDPIPAACEMVIALQTMVTRGYDVFDPVVVTVGRFASGTKDIIIPDEAEFEATLRSLSAQARAKLTDDVKRLVHGIAESHGLRVEIEFKPGYPVTINDEQEYDLAIGAVTDLFGEECYTTMATPEMGSEDMAFVFDEVPGAYLFISACPSADYENAPDNHSPRAAFDDSVLPAAAAWLAEVALRRLRLPSPR